MTKLVYSAITSLDGYVADADGNFDWSAPDEEVHAFINDLERGIGTYLLGRRMYEVMKVWEDTEAFDDNDVTRDFAQVWLAKDKIVYSRTLDEVSTARTRIEREFVPDAVRSLKAASESDLSVGGPNLAAEAIRAGLVDEFVQFVNPVVVGGGNHWLPNDVHIDLELLSEHRFTNGGVFLRYATRPAI